MKPQKTHTEVKILLYELQNIVKKLYPNKTTINPYKENIQDYLEQLPITEQLLFNNLLHTITLINQNGRLKEKQTIISSQTDIINTMQLLQNETLPINQNAIESYHKLYERYKNRSITLLDAQVVLHKSQTTIKRYFKALQKLQLVEKAESKQGLKHQYKLLKKPVQKEENNQSIYDQVFEQWKDYKGFTDLQTRT